MHRYVNTFNRLLTRRLICIKKNENYLPTKNIAIRYLFQTNSVQMNPVSLKGKDIAHRKSLQDLVQYINYGKVFYLKQLTNIFGTINFSTLNSEEAILLLKCCGSTVPDSSREQRNKVCQDIFTGLQQNNNLTIDVYNTYLKVCSENSFLVNFKDLLSKLKCKPNKDTFKLLLENVSHHGQINNALLILELMKESNMSVDSDIFNNLILAYTIEGGLDLAETILKTMRSAHIADTIDTRLVLLIGLIRRNSFKEFKKVAKEFPTKFTEREFLIVIEELGLNEKESWLVEIHSFYKDIPITREIEMKIEKICIHLIHMGHPESAMNIYKEFVTSVSNTKYGYNLLKGMLHCNIDINSIISFAKDVHVIEGNEYILENLTEIALKFRYVEQSWVLLRSLNTLRPHYFWPLLAHSGKTSGENGIFTALKKIKELNIKPDAETLENYVFPHCDMSNLKLLALKLQDNGFTIRDIISPFVIVLMKQKRIKKAAYLCNMYNVNITGDKLFELLSKSWDYTKDVTSIITLLKKYCESNTMEQDLIGCFLVDCTKLCKNTNDFKECLKLIKVIRESRLKISSYSGDVIEGLFQNCPDEAIKNDIRAAVNSVVDFGLISKENLVLTHPRNMDLEGLECHLIELQEKNMETRGVMRRLIQMHAGHGNLDRVTALRKIFVDSGYGESAGIKSSIMHSYVLGGYVDEAMNLYRELKTVNPEFTLDSFKFIDLAKLLIVNNKFDHGYNILQDEISKSNGFVNTKSILRNCRELLSSCKTEEEVDKVFTLLVKSGLCKPTNVILGPLVKVYLKSGDINKAVEKYIELSQKYRCTPLQLEIFCAVAKLENSELLQKVIRATESVHGQGPAAIGLISALAENGQRKALKKTLTVTNVPVKALLQKRCARWVEEGKIDPLLCLLNACDRMSEEFIDTYFIYKCIFDLYEFNGDYAGALRFYESIPEESTMRLHFKKDLQRIHAKGTNVNEIDNLKVQNKV